MPLVDSHVAIEIETTSIITIVADEITTTTTTISIAGVDVVEEISIVAVDVVVVRIIIITTTTEAINRKYPKKLSTLIWINTCPKRRSAMMQSIWMRFNPSFH